jgi:hypothetical protein
VILSVGHGLGVACTRNGAALSCIDPIRCRVSTSNDCAEDDLDAIVHDRGAKGTIEIGSAIDTSMLRYTQHEHC